MPLACGFRGGDDGDRTHDLSIANAALSQLSYVPTYSTNHPALAVRFALQHCTQAAWLVKQKSLFAVFYQIIERFIHLFCIESSD